MGVGIALVSIFCWIGGLVCCDCWIRLVRFFEFRISYLLLLVAFRCWFRILLFVSEREIERRDRAQRGAEGRRDEEDDT